MVSKHFFHDGFSIRMEKPNCNMKLLKSLMAAVLADLLRVAYDCVNLLKWSATIRMYAKPHLHLSRRNKLTDTIRKGYLDSMEASGAISLRFQSLFNKSASFVTIPLFFQVRNLFWTNIFHASRKLCKTCLGIIFWKNYLLLLCCFSNQNTIFYNKLFSVILFELRIIYTAVWLDLYSAAAAGGGGEGEGWHRDKVPFFELG